MNVSETNDALSAYTHDVTLLRQQWLEEQQMEDENTSDIQKLQVKHQRLKAVFEAISKHHAKILGELNRIKRENHHLVTEVKISRNTIQHLSRFTLTKNGLEAISGSFPSQERHVSPYDDDASTSVGVIPKYIGVQAAAEPLSDVNQSGKSSFESVEDTFAPEFHEEEQVNPSDPGKELQYPKSIIKFEPDLFLEAHPVHVLKKKDYDKKDQEVETEPKAEKSIESDLLSAHRDLADLENDDTMLKKTNTSGSSKGNLLQFINQRVSQTKNIQAYQLNEQVILHELQTAEEHNRLLCARLARDAAAGRVLQADHVDLIQRMGDERARFAERIQRRATEFQKELSEALAVAQNRISDLVATREKLMVELEITRIQLEVSQAEADKSHQKVTEFKAELVCSENRLSRVQIAHTEEIERMQKALQNANMRSFQSEQEVSSLRAELQAFQARLSQQSRNRTSDQHKKTFMSNESDDSYTNECEDEALTSTISQLQKEITKYRTVNVDLQERCSSLELQTQTLSRELKARNDDVNIAHDVELSLRKTLSDAIATLDEERRSNAAEKLKLELDHAEALSQAIESGADARLRLTRRVVLLEDKLVDSIKTTNTTNLFEKSYNL